MQFEFNGARWRTPQHLLYDLFEGYINPEELLSDPAQAEAVNDAVELIHRFFAQAEAAGVLEAEAAGVLEIG